MSTFDNAPPPDGWTCDPRDCPLPACDVCNRREHGGYGTYPPIPDNIILGTE